METGAETIQTLTLIRVALGIIMGTAARFVTLRIDSRQVPSYPNNYFINLVTGFLAASLGAVAIPALLSNDFAAVTFLMLAVQHFRDTRKQTQESLELVDPAGFAKRGSVYIDGIAKTFEARNYISLLTGLGTVLVLYGTMIDNLWVNLLEALLAGSLIIWALRRFTRGKCIGDICTLRLGEIEVRGSDLYVDGIWVTGMLGIQKRQALFQREGIAIVAAPKTDKQRLTLENSGQRNAILFDLARAFGVKELSFTRRNAKDGRVVVAFVPMLPDPEGILRTVGETPILESIRRRARWRK